MRFPRLPIPGDKPRMRAVLLAALALAVAGCGLIFETAGGSSDTDNTVAVRGEALYPDGSRGGEGLLVMLRRDDYLSPFPVLGKSAVFLRDVRTDSLGRFRIDSVDAGDYFIEIADGYSLSAMYRRSISPGHSTVMNLDPLSLEPTSSVSGTVLFRAGTNRLYVQAYGLERMVPVDMATGHYEVNLPAGAFTLRFVDPERARAFTKSREVSLAVGEGLVLDTIVLGDSTEPFAAWRHSSELMLNTAADGIAISSTLTGFPLLVRLDGSNFDFSQALPGGGDIRFSKSDGRTPLHYEVEYWDTAARKAALWVRVDTVYANTRAQSVYMYWGKSDAADSSDAAAVFDTGENHAGVWHLGDPGSAAPGGYRDATRNGNRGTGIGLADSSSVAGVIGRAVRLAGKSQGIEVPDSPSLKLGAGSFTLSAWIKADALTRKHQILSKRVDGGGDYELQVLSAGNLVAHPGPPNSGASGFQGSGGVAAGRWHYAAFVREGGRIYLYLDGARNASGTTSVDDVSSVSALCIGKDPLIMDEGWTGILDEVRISTRAHSADWIKLCHRTQAPGSRVLEWRRFP